MTGDTAELLPAAAKPYESFTELQEEYLKLSTLYAVDRVAPTPDFTALVKRFIARGVATGVFLERATERRGTQSMLDYWGSVLTGMGWRDLPNLVLRRFDITQAPDLSDKLCPYVGLDAFDEQTAPYFYGRKELCASVVSELKSRQVVVVVGPSGSGKSSVVRAGVLPLLREQADAAGRSLVVKELVPGSAPRLPELPSGTPVLLFIDQFEELFTLCDLATRRQFMESLEQAVKRPEFRVILTIRSDFESYLAKYDALNRLASHLSVPALSAAELRDTIEKPAAAVGLVYSPGVVEKLMGELLGEPAGLPLLQFTLLRLWKKKERNRVTMDAYREVGGGRKALAKHADEVFKSFLGEKEITARRILLRLGRPLDGYGAEVLRSRVKLKEIYASGEDPSRIADVVKTLAREGLIRHTGNLELPADEQQIEIAHEALVRNWPRFAEWLEKDKANVENRRRWESLLAEWRRLGKTDSGLLDAAQGRELKEWLKTAAASDIGYDRELQVFLEESERLEREQLQAQKARAQLREEEQLKRIAAAEALATAERTAKEAKARELEEATARATAERVLQEAQVKAENQRRKRLGWGVVILSGFTMFSLFLAFSADKASKQAMENAAAAQRERDQAEKAGRDKDTEKALKKIHQNERDTFHLQLLASQDKGDYRRYVRILQERLRNDPNVDTRSALYRYLATDPVATPFQPAASMGKTVYQQALMSPSGNFYVLTNTGKILIWGMDGKAVRAREPDPKLRRDLKIDKIMVAPDGSELASFALTSSVITRWSALGEQQSDLRPRSGAALKVRDALYSADGRYLAALYNDSTATVWSRKSGEVVYTLNNKQFGSSPAKHLAISHDGTKMMLVAEDGTGHLWTLSTSSASCPLHTPLPSTDNPGQAESISDGLFSSDGNRFYGYTVGGSVHYWDFTYDKKDKCKTPKILATSLYSTGQPIRGLALSGDDSRLITFGLPDNVLVYEVESTNYKAPTRHDCLGNILGVEFSPDSNSVLAFTSYGRVCIWTNKDPANTFPSQNAPKLPGMKAVHFTPDGSAILTVAASGEIKLLNLNGTPMNLSPLLPKLSGFSMGVTVGEFSDQGKFLAAGSFDGSTQVWQRTAQNEWQRLGKFFNKYAVRGIAFSPDETRILATSHDQYLHAWSLSSGCPPERPQCLMTINSLVDSHGESIVMPVATFTEDSAHIFVGFTNGQPGPQVNVFNTGDDTFARTIPIAKGNVSFSHNGTLIYAADGNSLTIRQGNSGQVLTTIKHSVRIVDKDYCAAKNLLATLSEDGDTKIWLLPAFTLLKEFSIGQNPINLQFSRDCEKLLLVPNSQAPLIYKTQSMETVKLSSTWRKFPGFGTFSASGKFVALSFSDNSVELWKDGQLRARWPAHTDKILAMEFDPREDWLFTTSSDLTGRLWPTDDELVHKIIGKYDSSPVTEEDRTMWLNNSPDTPN